MHNIYFLLRSNKRSGPFTLEELLQLNLKPFDLVWVEGKSAGWSYPSEIEALKMYVAEAPKPIDKEETANSIEPTSLPVISTNEKTIPSRPNSQHIYISLPSSKKIISESVNTQEPAGSFDESPEAKLERKAQALKNKIQAFAEKKTTPKSDNEIDTKYSRSLDDIKEEYSSWLYHQRKKRKSFPTKYIAPAVVGSILFITVYYFFSYSSNNKQKHPSFLATQNTDTTLPRTDNNLSGEEKSVLPKKKNSKTNKLSQKNQVKISSAKPERMYSSEEVDKVDAYLDSLEKASEKQATKDEEYVARQAVIKNEDVRESTKRNGEPVATPVSQTGNDPASFTELLKLSESTGNGTPHLNLYNNSNKYIKFVAVDVHYYEANQQLLKKKTFYFNEILPKSSARLYLPQEKNAASVKYQIGLISTDNGLYYASQ